MMRLTSVKSPSNQQIKELMDHVIMNNTINVLMSAPEYFTILQELLERRESSNELKKSLDHLKRYLSREACNYLEKESHESFIDKTDHAIDHIITDHCGDCDEN